MSTGASKGSFVLGLLVIVVNDSVNSGSIFKRGSEPVQWTITPRPSVLSRMKREKQQAAITPHSGDQQQTHEGEGTGTHWAVQL